MKNNVMLIALLFLLSALCEAANNPDLSVSALTGLDGDKYIGVWQDPVTNVHSLDVINTPGVMKLKIKWPDWYASSSSRVATKIQITATATDGSIEMRKSGSGNWITGPLTWQNGVWSSGESGSVDVTSQTTEIEFQIRGISPGKVPIVASFIGKDPTPPPSPSTPWDPITATSNSFAVWVYKADSILDDLTDAQEEHDGALIGVDPHENQEEVASLRKVVFKLVGPAGSGRSGYVTINPNSIKLWKTKDKVGVRVLAPMVYTEGQLLAGVTAWVEATAPSTTLRDGSISLRFADGDSTSAKVVTCDGARCTAFQVNIDIDGTTEADEETKGGYVGYEADPAKPRKLRKLTLQGFGPSSSQISCRVRFEAGANLFELSEDELGVHVIPDGKVYQLSEIAAPKTLYLRGLLPSATVRDITIAADLMKGASEADKLSSDKVKATVWDLDVKIHKPKVIDAGEAELAEAEEESKGSATFVNLDNDDAGSKFDGDDLVMTSVDDEFIKIVMTINPSDLNQGTIKLDFNQDGVTGKLWKSASKGGRYVAGADIAIGSEMVPGSNGKTYVLWLEATLAHTSQRAAVLEGKGSVSGISGDKEDSDSVNATFIGVEKVALLGIQNSRSDSDVLDADPQWPTTMGSGALRVFPDARMSGGAVETTARDKVKVEISLTVPPPFDIIVYARPFDVDDPAENLTVADDESNNNDNRGSVSGLREGQLEGADSSGIRAIPVPANMIKVENKFQVTMQPGDNYRVVVNGDRDFIIGLLNNDTETVAAATSEIADGKRIYDPKVTGTFTNREVRLSANYCSQVLTVWRFMHMEIDSMKSPSVTERVLNISVDQILEHGSGSKAHVSSDLSLLPIPDDSPNLDSSPPQNGRFENGFMIVDGANPAKIVGNGREHVVTSVPILVPYTATDNDSFSNDVISGLIARMVKAGSETIIRLSTASPSPVDWGDYDGGRISLGASGTTCAIVYGDEPTNSFVVLGSPSLSCKLEDDDVPGVLPSAPPLDDLHSSDDVTLNRFAQVYIVPLYDGGGNVANNQMNVPFVSNTESSDVYIWGSRPLRSTRYWVNYILMAYQDTNVANSQGDINGDFDPRSEGGTWASANNRPRRAGVLIYAESMRDGGMVSAWRSRCVVHEVGHTFGPLDEYTSLGSDGIMYGFMPGNNSAGGVGTNYRFVPKDVAVIRAALQPK